VVLLVRAKLDLEVAAAVGLLLQLRLRRLERRRRRVARRRRRRQLGAQPRAVGRRGTQLLCVRHCLCLEALTLALDLRERRRLLLELLLRRRQLGACRRPLGLRRRHRLPQCGLRRAKGGEIVAERLRLRALVRKALLVLLRH